MNIGLIGYGRMGKMVEQIAAGKGHSIQAIFDINQPLESDSKTENIDLFIDFSTAVSVPQNLQIAAALKIPVVEGTTGWQDQIHLLQEIEDLTCIFSPNFSIGVYVFNKIAAVASELISAAGGYDVFLHEWHHSGKADSPSGTAHKLANTIMQHSAGKDKIMTETSHQKIDDNVLHVTSTRAGHIPGTHLIGFDCEYDSIKLEHCARSRAGFVHGAVEAAEWILNRTGVYTMDDFMQDFLNLKKTRLNL